MGNLTKWLCDKLKVVNDDGKDPGSIFRKWFLDKSSQISRRNDLKKVGGILVTSFSPKKMVLTVSFKWRKLTSSSSAISFLKSSKKCQFNINSLNYTCEIDFWDSLGIYFCALCFLMWKSEKRTAKKLYKPSYMWPVDTTRIKPCSTYVCTVLNEFLISHPSCATKYFWKKCYRST